MRAESRSIFNLMQVMIVAMIVAVGALLTPALSEPWKRIVILSIISTFVVVVASVILHLSKRFRVDEHASVSGHVRLGGQDLEKVGLVPSEQIASHENAVIGR